MRYTKIGDLVVDPMCGSGTTLIEAGILGRRALGFDINPRAVQLTKSRLPANQGIVADLGDARDLRSVSSGSANLVALHPPYADIIRYSEGIAGDLSQVHDIDAFLKEIDAVARESTRIVRTGGHIAVLMGDLRRNRRYIPLAARVMDRFIAAGLVLREDIIKVQWNCAGTPRWSNRARSMNFHLIAHEHLLVFQRE